MPPSHQPDVTRLLETIRTGDDAAVNQLFPLIYSELRALAAALLDSPNPAHTLQPTALVHEAYLRMARAEDDEYRNRGHFMAVAAKAMRQILVDHSRRRTAAKRGRGERGLTIDDVDAAFEQPRTSLVDLDEAMHQLAALDERKGRVAEMRVFAGMELAAIADALGVSRSTVVDDWTIARAWLRAQLDERSVSA